MSVRVKAVAKLTGFSTQFIAQRVPIILRQYDAVIFPAFKAEINASQFFWPRTTVRRNGQVVSSPRNIVDTGALRASQQRFTIGGQGIGLGYRWGGPQAPYAPLVLTGYVSSGSAINPGRNWILPALEKHPLDSFFAAEWRRLAATSRKA